MRPGSIPQPPPYVDAAGADRIHKRAGIACRDDRVATAIQHEIALVPQAEMMDFRRRLIPPYALVSSIELDEDFLRMTNGKIDRRQLAELTATPSMEGT